MKYYLEDKENGKRTRISRENAIYYVGKINAFPRETLESYEKDTDKELKIELTFNYLVFKK